MKRLKKAVLLLGLLLLFSSQGFSQLSLRFNYSSVSRIGLGYQFSKSWWSEFRMISNILTDDVSPELIVGCNAIKKDAYNVYFGVGGEFNFFTGFTLPMGLEFYPSKANNNFSLCIEFEPAYGINDDKLLLLSSAGIKYRFNRKK